MPARLVAIDVSIGETVDYMEVFHPHLRCVPAKKIAHCLQA